MGIFCSLRGKAERGVTEGAYSVRGYFLACLGGKAGGRLRGSCDLGEQVFLGESFWLGRSVFSRLKKRKEPLQRKN